MIPKKNGYSLTVPIDVRQAGDAVDAVKVALVDASGEVVQSHVVSTRGKQPSVTFELDAAPRGARVVVGPEDADDESLPRMQAVSASVSSRAFRNAQRVTLDPIAIIHWPWFRWCRDFTINGTVLCPDGKPVPGAQVCAFDVDWFWIWQSSQQIGCAVTDVNGNFQLKFRWCCGWYPWWWWQLRTWEVDTKLAAELYRALPPEVRIKPIPLPDPAPDLRTLEAMIPQSRIGAMRPTAPFSVNARAAQTEAAPSAKVLEATTSDFLTRAEALRPVLAELIPNRNALRIWPWYPWYPWRDCNPDVIFKVTQFCDGEVKTIVDQNYWQTQWDIPTTYNVTLIANNDACCAGDSPCGDECISISRVCNIVRSQIDQTTGPTSGLAYPGAASAGNPYNADRPFAGNVEVYGPAECMGDDVDYYAVEISHYSSGWGPYTQLPASALAAFTRAYHDTSFNNLSLVYIPTSVGGHVVYPSRKKLEPSGWYCFGNNCQLLFTWKTSSATFADGTYRLRLQPYKETSPGVLTPQNLPECFDGEPNEIVITLDNRPSPDLAHVAANTAGHPCGSGTVHTCTTQPDDDIEAIRLRRADGTFEDVAACGIYQRLPGDSIEIDFNVSDPDEHLAVYTFDAHYAESQISDLLTGTTLAPIGADAVGPTYYNALTQGVTAPKWHGGKMTLTIPAAQIALKFPEPCCYLLRLHAYKRTIVSCDQRFLHDNVTEYSFFY